MRTRTLLATFLFLLTAIPSFAQYYYEWALVEMVDENTKPTVQEFRSKPEQAENGMHYSRIREWKQQENGLKDFVDSPYGFRMADQRIYVYDFEQGKELTAFDFTLSAGDEFTTINGIEWEVVEAKDTLVTDNGANEYQATHRLLSVRSKDGKRTDKWLEGFGSFTNHLMIKDLSGIKFAQMPWLFDEENCTYIARKLSCDPLYSIDPGWMENNKREEPHESRPHTRLDYQVGKLTYTCCGFSWPCRYYNIYYRSGDHFYHCANWEFEPHFDCNEKFWVEYTIGFTGVPAPVSGSYTLHFGSQEITTQIQSISAPAGQRPTLNTPIYDLQGQEVGADYKGIVVQGNKKVLKK